MKNSGKFNDNDKIRLSKLTNLPLLHVAAVDKFSILDELQNSNDTALLKVKKLNNKIAKESLFSFSFVRHPYTRYASDVFKLHFEWTQYKI